MPGSRSSALQDHRRAQSETLDCGSDQYVDFEKWGEYLPDGPLAMAFLDRLVERAIILKVTGKSYRAWLAQQAAEAEAAKKQSE